MTSDPATDEDTDDEEYEDRWGFGGGEIYGDCDD